jgi:hypothetical protein
MTDATQRIGRRTGTALISSGRVLGERPPPGVTAEITSA